jgi:hypothetical protein
MPAPLKNGESRETDDYSHRFCRCFAPWSLTLGIDTNRVVRLLGRGSKKMD